MRLIEGVDYFVRVVRLPHGIHGAVSPNDDDTYNIYLNADDTPERQSRALDHEVNHVRRDDFRQSSARRAETA